MTAPAMGTGLGGASLPLETRLASERAGLRRRSFASMAATVTGVAALAAVAGALVFDDGRWMHLPRVAPLLLWLLVAAVAFVVIRWYQRRDATALSAWTVAGAIETEQGLRAGSLRGALEVARTGVFGEKAARDVAGRLRPGVLVPSLAGELTRALALSAGAALVALAAVGAVSRLTRDGLAAAVHPIRAFRGTLLSPLAFDRLPADVPRGMPVTLILRAEGREQVTLSRRAAGEAWHDTTLTVDPATGVARVAIGALRAPLTVRLADGRAPEVTATIGVVDRGWIGDVALYAQYPAYLGRANESIEPVPPLRVPRGTTVRVSATLRGGAHDAMLTDGTDTIRFGGAVVSRSNVASPTFVTDSAAASVAGAPVSASITLQRDATWRWIARPADGNAARPELPDALAFAVVPDGAPAVVIRSPRSDSAIGNAGVVPITVAANDDHGIRTVALSVWRETADGTIGPRERIEVADPASPLFEGGASVALDGRKLEAGDRVHVVALATDDSPWAQTTASAELVLKVPSLTEQRAMARSLADSLARSAAQLAAQERKLEQSTNDASRNRELKGSGQGGAQSSGAAKSEGQSGNMSFSSAEKSKQLGRDQQQLSAKVDSLRRSAKELEDRLKSAGALDTALAARMRDVQRMLREAMTPEMQKQLQDLEKNTDRLSGTEAQRSMEQLAAQQRQMREQLEKSAEMLKRAALEGAMSTLRDEAKDLAKSQQQFADRQQGQQGRRGDRAGEQADDPKSLADRARALEKEIEQLTKRLEQAGAKQGASRTKAAQPMASEAAEAMQRAAQQAGQQGEQQNAGAKSEATAEKNGASQQRQGDRSAQEDALAKALAGLKDEKDRTAMGGQEQQKQNGPPSNAGQNGMQKSGAVQQNGAKQGNAQQGTMQQGAGQQGTPQPGGQQGGPPQNQQGAQGGQGGQPGSQGGQGGQQSAGNDARRASQAMDKAAQQLASARDAQVDAWKTELSQQLDQSINETMQLARQQADLEQRAKSQSSAEGMQGMQGEQGAVQQGVQQAAERLEQAGRSSSLLSQRSQRAMADAQRRVEQATQAAGKAGQAGGQQAAQGAMKDATEALNQALSSLVRDRERVNNAQSASGFTEMMEQLKQLAQQQSSLNGQMQGLNMLPGGAQGTQARQQSRALARQQREVANTLADVSDADETGRTDALAKEAQSLAQQIERNGVDPSVAARQQQLYRRLLDAGRFLEQDERDEQGPREAKNGGAAGRVIDGPASGKAGSRFAPPTWNELRGLGAEDRRLVIEYFRRLNGTGTP